MVHIHSSLRTIPWFSKRTDLSCQRPPSVFKIFYPDFQKKKTVFCLSAEPNRRQSFPFCFITSKWATILFYQLWQKIPALRGFEGYCRQYSASFSPVPVSLSGACHKNKFCFLQQADSILEQARKDFLREKTSEWNAAVDLMELRQAEQKLMERIGKEPLEAFQRMLFHRFLPCPLAPLFSQGILVELTKRIPLARFGSGSGGLSAVSENFWARKKRLIYQSLFHFWML